MIIFLTGYKCVIPTCDKPIRARELCHNHYAAWLRSTPKNQRGVAPRMDTRSRLTAESIMGVNGCWVWVGKCDPKGYGYISVGNKNHRAHRVAYQEFVGPYHQGCDSITYATIGPA